MTLRSTLRYEPVELQFGTSGRRGKVADLTQLEVYLNAAAELEYLQSLDRSRGGIVRGDEFFFARDLRPSSDRFVPEQEGRGEIAQTIVTAIAGAGMHPVNMGCIPTPALACYAMARGCGSMMVTGSHIPFDRNGYKTNSSTGELRKDQEAPINDRVAQIRARLYGQSADESPFNGRGEFKTGHRDLPPERTEAYAAWIARFTDFFSGVPFRGKRLLVFQHSAVGRDLLVDLLQRMGAEVIPAGRSDTFVPIDTENIGAAQLSAIQSLADNAAAQHGPLDAVVSTDGDSDRPLIVAVDPATGKARFLGGDLVGMVVAEYLKADAVVVPITCNDAVDRGNLARVLEPKTRIGSPFVIAGMEAARARGRRRVCGWEPNGGFLTGSDIERHGALLRALPTRDAFLPILAVLMSSAESGPRLQDLFARLPSRYSGAGLLPNCPRAVGLKVVEFLSSADRARVAEFFPAAAGFGAISGMDFTDGVRILFDNGDVVHVRPSGNADELRIYAVADSQSRADAIVAIGVAEPHGLLRQLEKAVA